MRIRVGREPATQDVTDHGRPAGPGLPARPHRGHVNRLIIGGQVEPFPAANVLGQVDEAFGYLGHNLSQERLTVAVGSVSQARSAIAAAIEDTQHRKAFGTPVASFQNTKFELAACSTEVEAAQAMLDRAITLHVEGELAGADAARVKLFCTEMQQRVVDRCLQLFGGYGYMMEYPIARLYTDARVARIYAGTSEVMKVMIAKSLGL